MMNKAFYHTFSLSSYPTLKLSNQVLTAQDNLASHDSQIHYGWNNSVLVRAALIGGRSCS